MSKRGTEELVSAKLIINEQKQPTEEFCKKKIVLKNFVEFTGKHLCHNLFFSESTGLHRCFPVNFANILRKTFYRTPHSDHY